MKPKMNDYRVTWNRNTGHWEVLKKTTLLASFPTYAQAEELWKHYVNQFRHIREVEA